MQSTKFIFVHVSPIHAPCLATYLLCAIPSYLAFGHVKLRCAVTVTGCIDLQLPSLLETAITNFINETSAGVYLLREPEISVQG